MSIEHWTLGSADEADGLTLVTVERDDATGELVSGYLNVASLYKARLLTQVEYEQYIADVTTAFNSGGDKISPKGGLLSDVGLTALNAIRAANEAKRQEPALRRVERIKKKIQLEISQGIVTVADHKDLMEEIIDLAGGMENIKGVGSSLPGSTVTDIFNAIIEANTYVSRDDQASLYALNSGTETELTNGGTWPVSAGGDGGNLGQIQSVERKVEMLARTNHGLEGLFDLTTTDEVALVARIIEVRETYGPYVLYVASEQTATM